MPITVSSPARGPQGRSAPDRFGMRALETMAAPGLAGIGDMATCCFL
jgi:hypothetical protein